MGPLFYYELVRLARQGRSTLLRCGYALAVFVALFAAYRDRFPGHDLWDSPLAPGASVPAPELARLAEGFVLAILWVQMAAVFVLTPAYLAGAIAGERERGTLELLFTTALRDREIVLGKLAARLAHLGGVLLAGLPLLALTQLWGGVDIRFLLAAFAATGLSLLNVGVLAVYFSVRARTVPGAMAACYLATAPAFFCCVSAPGVSTAGLLAVMSAAVSTRWPPEPEEVAFLTACAGLQAAVTLGMVSLAAARLRAAAALYPGGRGAVRVGPPELSRQTAGGRKPEEADVSVAPGRAPLRPVGDRPLLWKEVYQGGTDALTRAFESALRRAWPALLLLLLAVQGWLWSFLYLARGELTDRFARVGDLIRLALVLAAGAWCVATAFRAAGSVSGERDRRTLDSLLTLPSGRTALLTAKWLGAVLRGRLAGYAFAAAAAIGLFSGVLRPSAVPLLAASVAVHVALWAGLGLWLSVVSRTALRARTATALFLLVAFGGGWYYLMNDTPFSRRGLAGVYAADGGVALVASAAADVGLNPLRAWWFLALSRDETGSAPAAVDRLFAVRLTAAGCGTAALALLAGGLWWDAGRRFRGEPAR